MKSDANLRLIFVQMLFALTIGQIALKTGDVIRLHANPIDHMYLYFHLFLGVVILTTSWVGWQLSQSTENSEKINSVFSFQYLILILDIFLVIAYFMIVRYVEIDQNNKISPPNTNHTKLWVMIIFISYLLWDFLTKGIGLNYIKSSDEISYKKVNPIQFKQFWKRGKITLICLIISIIIYFYYNENYSSYRATCIYASLISLIFMFRGFKQELKRKYKLQEHNIPNSLKEGMSFPIQIEDSNLVFCIKYFIIKIVPVIIFVILTFVLFY